MSVIIRLQNLPWSANAADIRQFFKGLLIPEGGVHIVGGEEGDAFIAFGSDEDARLAMRKTGEPLKATKISLLLSSRSEMQKVIESARQQALQHSYMSTTATPSSAAPSNVPSSPQATSGFSGSSSVMPPMPPTFYPGSFSSSQSTYGQQQQPYGLQQQAYPSIQAGSYFANSGTVQDTSVAKDQPVSYPSASQSNLKPPFGYGSVPPPQAQYSNVETRDPRYNKDQNSQDHISKNISAPEKPVPSELDEKELYKLSQPVKATFESNFNANALSSMKSRLNEHPPGRPAIIPDSMTKNNKVESTKASSSSRGHERNSSSARDRDNKDKLKETERSKDSRDDRDSRRRRSRSQSRSRSRDRDRRRRYRSRSRSRDRSSRRRRSRSKDKQDRPRDRDKSRSTYGNSRSNDRKDSIDVPPVTVEIKTTKNSGATLPGLGEIPHEIPEELPTTILGKPVSQEIITSDMYDKQFTLSKENKPYSMAAANVNPSADNLQRNLQDLSWGGMNKDPPRYGYSQFDPNMKQLRNQVGENIGQKSGNEIMMESSNQRDMRGFGDKPVRRPVESRLGDWARNENSPSARDPRMREDLRFKSSDESSPYLEERRGFDAADVNRPRDDSTDFSQMAAGSFTKEGSPSGRSPFLEENIDARRGGFGRGSFDSNRAASHRGGFNTNKYQSDTFGSEFYRSRDDVRGKSESARGGFDGRGGFNAGRNEFERGRGGFERGRGGFEGGRGGYYGIRGGFEGGRGRFERRRGVYDGGRGGFDRYRAGFDEDSRLFDNEPTEFDEIHGVLDGKRGSHDSRSRFDSNVNAFETDMLESEEERKRFGGSRYGFDNSRSGFESSRGFGRGGIRRGFTEGDVESPYGGESKHSPTPPVGGRFRDLSFEADQDSDFRNSSPTNFRGRGRGRGRGGGPVSMLPEQPPSTCSVEILNVPVRASYRQVKNLFRGIYVPRDSIKLLGDEQGNRIPVALLRFSSYDDAFNSLQFDGAFIFENRVRVRLIDEEVYDKHLDVYTGGNMANEFSSEGWIHIGGLPAGINEDSVCEIFSTYYINDIVKETLPGTADATGSFFMRLSTSEEANSVLHEMNGFEVRGRPLRLRAVSSKEVDQASLKSADRHLVENNPDNGELSVGKKVLLPHLFNPTSNPYKLSRNHNKDVTKKPLLATPGAPLSRDDTKDADGGMKRSIDDVDDDHPFNNKKRSNSPLNSELLTDSLLITNVNMGTARIDVIKFFEESGITPELIHFLPFDDKRGGSIYVVLPYLEDCREAVKRSRTQLGTSVVNIQLVPKPEVMAAMNLPFNPGELIRKSENPRQPAQCKIEDPFIPEQKRNEKDSSKTAAAAKQGEVIPDLFGNPGCVVALGNVPLNATTEDIIAFLSADFPRIMPENVIRRYNEHNQPTSDARVAFESTEQAQEALQKLSKRTIFNRNIELSLV